MKIIRVLVVLVFFTNYTFAQKTINEVKTYKLDLINLWDEYSGNDDALPIHEFGKFEIEDSNSMLLCVNRG